MYYAEYIYESAKKEGIEIIQSENVLRMHDKGMSVDDIAECLDLTVNHVQEILENMPRNENVFKLSKDGFNAKEIADFLGRNEEVKRILEENPGVS